MAAGKQQDDDNPPDTPGHETLVRRERCKEGDDFNGCRGRVEKRCTRVSKGGAILSILHRV